jgi:plastocyanin
MNGKPWLSLLLSTAFCFFIASRTEAGTIVGKVNFTGKKPAVSMITMGADQKCLKIHEGKQVPSDRVVVNPNNTLEWVFVYVKKGLEGKKFPAPKDKKTIEQKGCTYHPHVFGMMAGQQLEIVNSDPTLHNIHALPKNSTPFNMAQPKQGMKNTKTFASPEVMVKIKCDVHNWMAAWVGVLDNPFYSVTNDKGEFEIKGLPAGEYEIEAWHEAYGTQTMKVTVGASDTKTADFSFAAK